MFSRFAASGGCRSLQASGSPPSGVAANCAILRIAIRSKKSGNYIQLYTKQYLNHYGLASCTRSPSRGRGWGGVGFINAAKGRETTSILSVLTCKESVRCKIVYSYQKLNQCRAAAPRFRIFVRSGKRSTCGCFWYPKAQMPE